MHIEPFLAPMCGVTDLAFRQLCRRHAPVTTCVEMLSARALYQKPKPPAMIPGEGVQLEGNDPKYLVPAAKLFPEAGFIELNAGCPVNKVVKCGHGAALLKDLPRLRECVDALVDSLDKPVTLKTRIGWDKSIIPQTADSLRGAGLERVVMHARTAEQGYSGKADWAAIRDAVKQFDCPVVGNGDVKSYADAARMIRETKCAGVAIGRAAMTNPLVFKAIAERRDFELSPQERAFLFAEYAALADGMKFVEVRSHAMWLCSGIDGAARVRAKLCRAWTMQGVFRVVAEACGLPAESFLYSGSIANPKRR